jgi:hypothetical protein
MQLIESEGVYEQGRVIVGAFVLRALTFTLPNRACRPTVSGKTFHHITFIPFQPTSEVWFPIDIRYVTLYTDLLLNVYRRCYEEA